MARPCGCSQKRRADFRHDPGLQRMVEINHHQAAIAQDVGVGPGDGDAARTVQRALRIESCGPLEKIVRGIAVEQRAHARALALQIGIADDHQAFVLVGHIEEAVHEMNGLFFVLLAMACAAGSTPSVVGVATAVAYFVGR